MADSDPLAENYRSAPPEAFEDLRRLVKETYYGAEQWAGPMADTEACRQDLANILFNRLDTDRKRIVPWLNKLKPLSGMKILEIGCGTGSSTLAMAEQGAHVVGIDIDEPSLRIAQERCRIYGIDNVEFLQANASSLPVDVKRRRFDLIIFFASLEHMTYDERLAALADTWEMLPAGGLLSCADTPNRLWYQDPHTSLMPFYHWLPDELAIRYARFSSRESLRDVLPGFEPTEAAHKRLMRAGRGVSFHEFDLAIAPVQTLKLASCQNEWLLKQVSGNQPAKEGYQRFIQELMAIAPGIHPAWFFNALNLVLEKP